MSAVSVATEELLRIGKASLRLGDYYLQLHSEDVMGGFGLRIVSLRPKLVDVNSFGVSLGLSLFSPPGDAAGNFVPQVYFAYLEPKGKDLLLAYISELCDIVEARIKLNEQTSAGPEDFLQQFLRTLPPAEYRGFFSATPDEQQRIFLEKSQYVREEQALQSRIADFLQASCKINTRTYVTVKALREQMALCVKNCREQSARIHGLSEADRRAAALKELRGVVKKLDERSNEVSKYMLTKIGISLSSVGIVVPEALDGYYELRKQYHYQEGLLACARRANSQ